MSDVFVFTILLPYIWDFFFFIHEYLPVIALSVPVVCYQWGFCLSCKSSTMELLNGIRSGLSYFHLRRPYCRLNLGCFDCKFNALANSDTNQSNIIEHNKHRFTEVHLIIIIWVNLPINWILGPSDNKRRGYKHLYY